MLGCSASLARSRQPGELPEVPRGTASRRQQIGWSFTRLSYAPYSAPSRIQTFRRAPDGQSPAQNRDASAHRTLAWLGILEDPSRQQTHGCPENRCPGAFQEDEV